MAGYACTNLTRRGHLQVGSPAAERLIASARRKCLDPMLISPCLGSRWPQAYSNLTRAVWAEECVMTGAAAGQGRGAASD